MDEPRLIATFRTRKDGSLRTASSGNYTLYNIRLSVEKAPDGTQTVTYVLDPSFKSDQVLRIPYGVQDFREDITTYGDFFITVAVEGERPQTREWFASAFATRLSEALKAGHPAPNRPREIEQAISQIANL